MASRSPARDMRTAGVKLPKEWWSLVFEPESTVLGCTLLRCVHGHLSDCFT